VDDRFPLGPGRITFRDRKEFDAYVDRCSAAVFESLVEHAAALDSNDERAALLRGMLEKGHSEEFVERLRRRVWQRLQAAA
jgi:hypothetical protein